MHNDFKIRSRNLRKDYCVRQSNIRCFETLVKSLGLLQNKNKTTTLTYKPFSSGLDFAFYAGTKKRNMF